MKIKRIIVSAALGLTVVMGAAMPLVSAAGSSDSKKDSGKSSASSKTDATATTDTAPPSAASLQGYAADSVLQTGTVVQLSGDKASKVGPATQKDLGHMFGVVVDAHTLSLTISNSSLQNEAYVATSGTYPTLVSTQGGAIGAGDYLTMSSVNGVVMKADDTQKTVFGRAAASFNSKADGVGQESLKDTAGKANKTVTLGVIPVAIDIRHNPNDKSTKANVPNWLKRVGEAIAEKPVGPLRIYLSIAITGVTIVIALVTLYSGVRSSIAAIGRNPLSKKAIFRGLLEIILTSIIILIIGLFAVYLLLKL
jgi:hypothetical protein